MNKQKPSRCYCCKDILSQVEEMSWVDKQSMWTIELHFWPKDIGQHHDVFEERLCQKCKDGLMKYLTVKSKEKKSAL